MLKIAIANTKTSPSLMISGFRSLPLDVMEDTRQFFHRNDLGALAGLGSPLNSHRNHCFAFLTGLFAGICAPIVQKNGLFCFRLIWQTDLFHMYVEEGDSSQRWNRDALALTAVPR